MRRHNPGLKNLIRTLSVIYTALQFSIPHHYFQLFWSLLLTWPQRASVNTLHLPPIINHADQPRLCVYRIKSLICFPAWTSEHQPQPNCSLRARAWTFPLSELESLHLVLRVHITPFLFPHQSSLVCTLAIVTVLFPIYLFLSIRLALMKTASLNAVASVFLSAPRGS